MKLGKPVFELEQWPYDTILEYRAMNLITPFTQASINARDGVLIEIQLNQNKSKGSKHTKASDVLRYLKHELDDDIEHPQIKKVKGIMSSLSMMNIDPMEHDIYKAVCGSLIQELEKVESERDIYFIKKLYHFKNLIEKSSENYKKQEA